MTDSYKYDLAYHRFADFMGVDKFVREDIDVASKLALLYDWAVAKTKTEDFEQVVGKLEDLRKEIGTNDRGKTLVGDLYKFARLEMDNLHFKEKQREQREAVKKRQEEREETIRKSKDVVQKHNQHKESLQRDVAKGMQENTQAVKEYQKNVYREPQTKIPVVDYSKPSSPQPV